MQYGQSQAAAAAAANAVAQQHQQQQQAQQQQNQQYNRMSAAPNGNSNTTNTMTQTLGNSRDSGLDHGPSSIFSANGEQMSEENRRVLEWIAQVLNANTRESALLELSKKREQVPELALILWHSFGVMTSLLQEIISVYPLLNPSQLTAAASNRVCNALALLQCVASHSETRALFLGGEISCKG
jgi:CCR4-NOT transcription complex subunit 9